jgi:hypothetical protein
MDEAKAQKNKQQPWLVQRQGPHLTNGSFNSTGKRRYYYETSKVTPSGALYQSRVVGLSIFYPQMLAGPHLAASRSARTESKADCQLAWSGDMNRPRRASTGRESPRMNYCLGILCASIFRRRILDSYTLINLHVDVQFKPLRCGRVERRRSPSHHL